jgi:hypothetical protein
LPRALAGFFIAKNGIDDMFLLEKIFMSYLALVGKGLIHAVELTTEPLPGVEFNLNSSVIAGGPGRFRITELLRAEGDLPHCQIARLGNIPIGQESVPWCLTSC